MIKSSNSLTAKESETDTSQEAWVGFVCRQCGAPFALHRSNNGSRRGERSTRGWRVTCTSCGVPDFHEPGSPMVTITTS